MELMPLYIPRAHSNVGTKVRTKPREEGDEEPVIDLDNHSLEILRRLVLKHFAGDLTIGEEDKKSSMDMAALLAEQTRGIWTIDGLDGTWSFSRRTRSYGAMLSRRIGGRIHFAAAFRPIEMRCDGTGFFVAEHEKGAWEWCSDCKTNHKLRTAAPGRFDSESNPRALERFTALLEGSSKNFGRTPVVFLVEKETTRASLSSCVAATTVARGDASALVAKGNKPWDNWPAALLIQEAGGVVTDFQGNPIATENCGDMIAAANEEALLKILEILNP
jgi:fructose-1,6-bisphosphatase/inositol monophosphatase family enzyme